TAFSAEQSQMVVDSGLSLQRLILQSANKGLGGLIPFYGEAGTVGGALYRGSAAEGVRITSFLRSITLLMPPTKMRPEAYIVRHKADWLAGKQEGYTRLREQRSVLGPVPVILTAQFQLTSLRAEELARRLQGAVTRYNGSRPGDPT